MGGGIVADDLRIATKRIQAQTLPWCCNSPFFVFYFLNVKKGLWDYGIMGLVDVRPIMECESHNGSLPAAEVEKQGCCSAVQGARAVEEGLLHRPGAQPWLQKHGCD